MANRPLATRRTLLKAGLGGAAGAGLLGCEPCGGRGAASVQTLERVSWHLASSFPSSLDTIYGAAEVLAERVAALTDGNFRIKVHQAGELVGAFQVMDAVESASVEIGQTAGYYYTGKNPALAFDTCMPFGLTSRQQTAWLTEGGGGKLMAELYGDFSMVPLMSGNTGVQMGGWFRNPVPSLTDFKGLKMRIPGLGGKVMDALGVLVQAIPGGDIATALERGAIDAAEWVGPYDDEKLGFWQLAKYYYYPGWWEPGPNLSFLVGRKAWDGLSEMYRAVLTTAAREAASTMQARYDARNAPALQKLIGHGVELRKFSQDVMEAAAEASADLQAEFAAADPTYARIRADWTRFRTESFQWFGTAERAYAEYSFL